MADLDTAALRAKVAAIRKALASDALMPETAQRFLRHLVVGRDGSRLDALLDAADERDLLISSRDAFWRDHSGIVSERDRARDAAAALRAALEQVRDEYLASVEDYAAAGIDPSESTDAIVIATAALARTDPLRADV